eukprot:364331-Chlamydomonas_euryale.AAC.2
MACGRTVSELSGACLQGSATALVTLRKVAAASQRTPASSKAPKKKQNSASQCETKRDVLPVSQQHACSKCFNQQKLKRSRSPRFAPNPRTLSPLPPLLLQLVHMQLVHMLPAWASRPYAPRHPRLSTRSRCLGSVCVWAPRTSGRKEAGLPKASQGFPRLPGDFRGFPGLPRA